MPPRVSKAYTLPRSFINHSHPPVFNISVPAGFPAFDKLQSTFPGRFDVTQRGHILLLQCTTTIADVKKSMLSSGLTGLSLAK